MKKQLLIVVCFIVFSALRIHAQFTITNLNLPVQHPGVSVIDIDGDGNLDILISGENNGSDTVQLFKNNGLGVFTAAPSPFTRTTRTSYSWGDINNDGKLDLLTAGFAASGAIDSVYTSNGAGVFTTATGIVLPQVAPTAGFADLNNDGYTDIYVFGNQNFGHPKIFFNNKAGGFTESDQFGAFAFVDPVVVPVDYDNDKDLDLFVVAGYDSASNGRFSKMFVNDGNGHFTVKDLGLDQKGNGSAEWADYNGDGYLDVLFNGDGVPGDDWKYLLYKSNTAASFTRVDSFIYRQDHTGNGGRMIDWDNDGDIDLIVTGYNGTTQATDIYINNGGTFTPFSGNATIPGLSENSIETADIDGDGDLDLVESGFSGNDFNGTGSAFNSNVSLIIKNPATLKNTPPTAPTNLQISGNQAAINFAWAAATDATTPQNALSYNMYLTNDQGKWFYDPLADTTTGKLTLQKMGNVWLNKGWILKNLPAGNYCWGVQAIDNSWASSKFTRSCFTINANGSLPVVLTSFTVTAAGNKAKISWITQSEQNSDYFKVEHSIDGQHFSMLTSVKAQGISTTANTYTIYDNNPSKGINYYRLTYYDKDGKPTIYDIKTVNFTGIVTIGATVYPNPVSNAIGFKLVNFTGKQIAATLSDMTGKVMDKEVISANVNQSYYQLNFKAKLAAGTYILHLSGDGLETGLQVFVQ